MNLQKLGDLRRLNRAACGVHLSFLNPELIEFCGLLGFEWLFLDAEHQPLNPHLCRSLVRAADLAGLTCVVRVPEIETAVIESYLDAGVLGIIAPKVSSADEAQELVAAVKFAPEGVRGSAHGCRAARYGLSISHAEFIRAANRSTLTAALIETRRGIDNLESIAAVPGLDYIGIGPNDLGLSFGIEGGMSNPEVRGLVEGARARIKACGKSQITVVSNSDQARRAFIEGAQLIAMPDVALFASAARAFIERGGFVSTVHSECHR